MWYDDVNMARLILVRKTRKFILDQINVYIVAQF